MKTNRFLKAAILAAALTTPIAAIAVDNGAAPPVTGINQVHYQKEKVDGIDVFYREAGPKNAPVVLLLHGFPTSSQMFRGLIPQLADKYHVVAPGYPGYGYSEMPDRAHFAYTFDNVANVIEKLTRQLGGNHYALYMMDYGAPVGFRLAAKNPAYQPNALRGRWLIFWQRIRQLLQPRSLNE